MHGRAAVEHLSVGAGAQLIQDLLVGLGVLGLADGGGSVEVLLAVTLRECHSCFRQPPFGYVSMEHPHAFRGGESFYAIHWTGMRCCLLPGGGQM